MSDRKPDLSQFPPFGPPDTSGDVVIAAHHARRRNQPAHIGSTVEQPILPPTGDQFITVAAAELRFEAPSATIIQTPASGFSNAVPPNDHSESTLSDTRVIESIHFTNEKYEVLDTAPKKPVRTLADVIRHVQKEMEIKHRRRATRSMKILDAWSAVLPARVNNEELGDYIEDINRRAAEGQRHLVYVRLATAIFWTGVHALSDLLQSLSKRKAS
jgi:hypothetical protein